MANEATTQAQDDDGLLTYRGTTWRVQSEPVVIESDNGSELVEVWVKRGEDIGQPGEG